MWRKDGIEIAKRMPISDHVPQAGMITYQVVVDPANLTLNLYHRTDCKYERLMTGKHNC